MIKAKKLCVHFPECGGCQNLDTSYPEQINKKQTLLEETFVKRAQGKILDIIVAPEEEGFRYKALYPLSYDEGKVNLKKKTKVNIGFYKANSHVVSPQKRCFVQAESINLIAQAFRNWAQAIQVSIYKEETGKGWLRNLLIRGSAHRDHFLLGLVVRSVSHTELKQLSQSLKGFLEEVLGAKWVRQHIKGALLIINKADDNTIVQGEEVQLWGVDRIVEHIGDLKYSIRLQTFFQVNPSQIENLYNCISSEVEKTDKVLDLFCGNGTISLWLANQCQEVIGYEFNPDAIVEAEKNALLNEITNVTFKEVDLYSPIAHKEIEHANMWIVDPPRRGLNDDFIKLIQKQKPSKICYVSCSLPSLQRDLKKLESSYIIKTIQGVDLFPHTNHIETVVHLVKR